jgi:16S rRNA (guanine527-N7)-methyltransferase
MDVGSGGGSPAIPLKIARPALSLTMVESKERKSAFLREAARSLGLANTNVITERYEQLAHEPSRRECVDLITVRAVRPDDALYRAAAHLLRARGELLVFSGKSAVGYSSDFMLSATVPLGTQSSYLHILIRS